MKTMSLKLKMYAGNVNVVNNNMEKTLLRILLWSFGILALLYVLFLGNMVRDIIARRSLEISVRSLSSEVRDLELTYLSMSNNVDLTLSYSLGFKEIQKTFITRKSLGFRSTSEPFVNMKVDQSDL